MDRNIARYLTIVSKPVVITVLGLLLCAMQGRAAQLQPAGLSKTEIMQQGERMYRQGLLPTGLPMNALIRADVEIDSTAFSCSSCHLRAGLGSLEGGVVTPPTNGAKLYNPYRRPPSLNDIPDRAGRYVYAKTVSERPAYTRESLATALRFGTDPAGQVFNDIMPRYPLNDRDMSILISYLEALSSEFSPGATNGGYAFATVITDDVSKEDRQALLDPLQKFIAGMNQQADMYNDFIKSGYSPTIDMKYAFRRASLTVWELKGPPETWPTQLAGYYSKSPVFAILGGISNGSWQPIHDFCEARRLPCLFPITDLPVVSETDWYTFYFNKGYYQEGEATARFLNRNGELAEKTQIVQIVQDSPAGKALAAGFQKTWSDLERPAVTSLTLKSSQLRDPKFYSAVLEEKKPGVLLLWTDAEILPGLPAMLARQATPTQVYLSSSYLGKQTLSIPESVRDNIYLTYPYRLTPYVGSKEGFDAAVPILTTAKDIGNDRITSRTNTMLRQLTQQGLKLLYDNLYRDHLFDVMSMQMDQIVRDYERLSFGPGQRYVSKGCYIIQLGQGAATALQPKSEWVIH